MKTRKSICHKFRPNYKPMSVRDLASVTGASHATISRFQNNKEVSLSNAKKLLPILNDCPCCGKST